MTDLSQEDVYNAFDGSLREHLQQFTKGRGQYYLQVYVGNKEYQVFAENTKQLAQSMDESNKLVKENNNKLGKFNDGITDTVEALENNTKESKEQTKAQKANTEALNAYNRRLIEAVSKTAGFFAGIMKQEMDLTKNIAESNTMYKDTAKELNTYARGMNMTLEEYTQYMKENAAEFNTLQRVFGDVRDATALQWDKISKQTGATSNEMNKALASYTKLVTNSGEISNMTTAEFTAGATEYIKETKLLAKALGVNTETILKQTEQAQKQWQLQLLMMNPNNKATVQGMLAAGASTEEILYSVGGIYSEEVAQTMAMNQARGIMLDTIKQEHQAGNIRNAEDFGNVAGQIVNSQEYQNAYGSRQELLSSGQANWIAYTDEKFATAMGINNAQMNDILSKLSEGVKIDEDNQLNANVSEINKLESTFNDINNEARTLLMSGSKLSENLETYNKVLKEGIEYWEKFKKEHGGIIQTIGDVGGKLGMLGIAISGLAVPIKAVWRIGTTLKSLITPINSLKTAAKATEGAFQSVSNNVPKFTSSLGNITNGLKNFLLSTPKMGLGTVGVAATALAASGYAGYKLEEKTGVFSGILDKLYFNGKREKDKKEYEKYDLSKNPEKLTEAREKLAKIQEKASERERLLHETFDISIDKGVYKYNGKDVSSPQLNKSIQQEWDDWNMGRGAYKWNDKDYEKFEKKYGKHFADEMYKEHLESVKDNNINDLIRKAARVQDSSPSQIASSQVQNKAEVQAEAKIKAETEAEAKQSKDEQKSDQENVFNLPTQKDNKTNLVKMESEEETLFNLRVMVGLLKEMTNHLSQMSSQIPMNNYGSVN